MKVEAIESGKQLASLAQGCHASLFSEGVELSGEPEELFAALSDYCREYSDCAELYSATDKLAVYEQLETYVAKLVATGFWLVAATRAVIFRGEASAPGVRTDILYVLAFPKGSAPEHIAVQRQVRFA